MNSFITASIVNSTYCLNLGFDFVWIFLVNYISDYDHIYGIYIIVCFMNTYYSYIIKYIYFINILYHMYLMFGFVCIFVII